MYNCRIHNLKITRFVFLKQLYFLWSNSNCDQIWPVILALVLLIDHHYQVVLSVPAQTELTGPVCMLQFAGRPLDCFLCAYRTRTDRHALIPRRNTITDIRFLVITVLDKWQKSYASKHIAHKTMTIAKKKKKTFKVSSNRRGRGTMVRAWRFVNVAACWCRIFREKAPLPIMGHCFDVVFLGKDE